MGYVDAVAPEMFVPSLRHWYASCSAVAPVAEADTEKVAGRVASVVLFDGCVAINGTFE
jgi:hypothetical protein